jgi:transcriptional repressor NrdR
MRCPFCSEPDSKVTDSRLADDGATVRRRRECVSCGRRFTSYERPEEPRLYVIKKDGRREPFDRVKIMAGISKACEKRPVPRETIEAIVQDIERQARDKLLPEIPTSFIGDLVMRRLRELDDIAYVRFASVYKNFRDVESFVQEVQQLSKPASNQAGREV